jgi:diguanylate cyclase (GGDEF)-like protein
MANFSRSTISFIQSLRRIEEQRLPPEPLIHSPRLLVVSDSRGFADELLAALRADGIIQPICEFSSSEDEPSCSSRLFDLVVVDQRVWLAKQWIERREGRQVIPWSPGDQGRLDSIRYALLKSQYEQLLAEWGEVKDQVRQLDLLRRRVTPFDPRTGWHSHAHIIDRCQEEIARALRYSLPIALVVVDIVNLEDDERTLDPDFANSLVTALAHRIRPICRHGDVLGHYGSTSVLVILLNTDREGGERFSERANQALLPPLVVEEVPLSLDWSIALATREPGTSTTPTDLLNQLERRVERARELGRRGVVVAD